MAVVVTGGLGVIGSQLVEELNAHSYETVVVDNAVRSHSNYVRADVCRYEELQRVFRTHDVTHVFHLAGEVGRVNGELHPNRCVDVNISGTMHLASLCREHDAKLLFASSSEVYGERGDELLVEEMLDDDLGGPLPHNCYGMSKLHAEHYLRHFCTHYGLQAIAFRFFMCYGPPERPDSLRSAMTNFVAAGLNGSPIKVHRGTARSWCYIGDVVRACRMAMEGVDFASGYSAFNIGNPGLVSMDEIATMVCDATGAPHSLIEVVDPTPNTTLVKNASFQKALDRFGYEASIDVREGIRLTVEWQKALRA